MALDFDTLLRHLKIRCPVGMELPRDPSNNTIAEDIIAVWADDGAEQINERRGRTTLKETTITTVESVQTYTLPTDCRIVEGIIRNQLAPASGNTILGIPVTAAGMPVPPIGLGMLYGQIPSGQEISPSLDLINRQRLSAMRREDQWEIISGAIRFLFPIIAGEGIVLRYRAVDRSYDTFGSDKIEPLVGYLLFKNMDWYLSKNAISVVQDGSRLGVDGMAAMTRQKLDLEARWNVYLNNLPKEVNQ